MSVPGVHCQVAVVGGGISGLALATELKAQGLNDVLVLEREANAGGVPRHCGHYPFGWREFRRMLKGPDYATRLVMAAQLAGVRLLCNTTVTQLHPGGRLSLLTEDGQQQLQAERVVVCTGARESTRAQRLLSGQRPQGVLSTGALQSIVYLKNRRPFRYPAIIGSELVSLSAITTCRHMGIRPVAMIEENERLVAPYWMRAYPMMHQIPVFTRAEKLRIEGKQQVEGIRFTDRHGSERCLPADGIIVSGRFTTESALIRDSHLQVDPDTRGPVIDQQYRCSDPAYYCTGNLLRPVESAAWCWQEGRQTAQAVAHDLLTGSPLAAGLELSVNHPALKLAIPQRITPLSQSPAMPSGQLRVHRAVNGVLLIQAGTKTLYRSRIKSRQERRWLFPLQPLLEHAREASDSTPITLSIIDG